MACYARPLSFSGGVWYAVGSIGDFLDHTLSVALWERRNPPRTRNIRREAGESVAGENFKVMTRAEKILLQGRLADIRGLTECFPAPLLRSLVQVARRRGDTLYLVGGTVRDWLLGRTTHDLDLTVASGAEEFCRELIAELGGGAFVQLGTPDEEAARVVWKGVDVDISAFRGGASQLAHDLALRDFSINSLAVDFVSLMRGDAAPDLIDPMGGLNDLERGLLCHCPGAFQADPLRLLRGYRFMATLGFELVEATRTAISDSAGEIGRVAAERVRYELDLIIQTDRGAQVLWQMHEAGLLRYILPELYAGEGVKQPDFHHLDVFQHNFQALREMERLLAASEAPYSQEADEIQPYLADTRVRVCLKWAALFHDIGKPAAETSPATDEDRVTFYGHDEIGRKMFDGLARRLKWSNEERERTGHLIAMHMHPFHLCNVRREQKLTVRAALKLCRRAGNELPGLFLLAMSDSLASRGALKPEDMEGELVDLYNEVMAINRAHIRPALSGPPLLGGRDLIEHCGLRPGPIFSIILDELQALQIEGTLTSRQEALDWVERFVREGETGRETVAG